MIIIINNDDLLIPIIVMILTNWLGNEFLEKINKQTVD